MPQLLKRLGSITPRCRRADPVLPFSDPFAASPDGEGSPESKEAAAPSPPPKTKVITDRSPYVVGSSPAGSAKKQRLSLTTEDQPCAALPLPMSPVSASSTSSKKKKQPPRTVSASPGCLQSSPGSSAKKPRRAALEPDAEQDASERNLSPTTARRRLELGADQTPVKEASPLFAGKQHASPEVSGTFNEEVPQLLDLRATAAAELGRPPTFPMSSASMNSADHPPSQEMLGAACIPEIRPASARATVGPRTAVGPSTSGTTFSTEPTANDTTGVGTTSPARPKTSPAPQEVPAPKAPTQPRRPQTARPAAPRPPQALARASSALLSSAAKAASSAANALTPRRLMSPGRLMSPRRMMSPGRVMTPRANGNSSEEMPDTTTTASESAFPTAAQPAPQTQPRTPRSWLPSPRTSSRKSSKPPVGHSAATAAAHATPPRSRARHAVEAAGVGPLDSSDGEEADADPLVKPMLSAVYGRPLTREEVAAAVSVCPEVSWLAQCALMCPLPPGWRQCNGDGTDGAPPFLYACELTGEVSEQPPHLQRFSRLARLLMTSVQRPEDTAAAAAWLEREIQDAHSEAGRMKESWTQSIDPARGVKFWHDPISRRSCWENPAAPAEFIACVAERLLATEAFAKLSSTADTATLRVDSARSGAPSVRADSARKSKARAQSGMPRAAAASPSPPAAAAPSAPGSSRRVRKASSSSAGQYTAQDASMQGDIFAADGHEHSSDVPESRRRGRSKALPNHNDSQTARCRQPPAKVPKLPLGGVQQDDEEEDDDTPKAPAAPAPPKQFADSGAGDTESFAIFTPPGSPAKLPVESKSQSTSQAQNGDAASALAGAAAALAVAAATLASARGPAADSNSESVTGPAYEATLLPSETQASSHSDQDAKRHVLEQACVKARAEEEARQRAEFEAQQKAEEHARLQAQLEAETARRKAAEEACKKAEEAARLKAEEDARQKAEEAARQKAEAEARQKAKEERRKAREEARQRAEEEARQRAAEETRVKAEEEARQTAAEEARLKAEGEARQRAVEEAQLKAQQEAQQRAAEAARLKAEEERRKAEEEARQAEVKAQQKATEEVAKLKANKEADAPLAASPARKLTVPAMPGLEAASPARKLTVPAMPGTEADAPHAASPAKKLTMPAMPGPPAASPAKNPQTPRTKLTVPAMPSPGGLKLTVPAMPTSAGLPPATGTGANGGS